MSYTDKLQEAKEKVYHHSVASKILDLMDKLRLNNNENSKRRWIWELIQNAKDVAADNRGVSIEIDFQKSASSSFLEFRHNGKPFTTENITFLIEQVSTKTRNLEDSRATKITGKFGTGFIATHLLSEEVEVRGVIKEPDEPYRKFDLVLDRTGRDIDQITKSVQKSISGLESLDRTASSEKYSPDNLNTIFRYKLNSDGIQIALAGLEDLQTALPYTLIFVPEIRTVHIIHERVRYVRGKVVEQGKGIRIHTVLRCTPSHVEKIRIATVTKNDTFIAIEVDADERSGLKGLGDGMPRLFCDFPLVGSEHFPFPVVINSAAFNPNEPRSGVYLTGKSDPKVEENESIVADATQLYFALLDHASTSGWGNIYCLASLPPLDSRVEWLSRQWVKDHVLDRLRSTLLKTPIVDTEQGNRISILNAHDEPNIYFPSHKKLRLDIWNLAESFMTQMLPRKANVDDWAKVIWSDCPTLTLDELTQRLVKIESLNQLEDELSLTEDATLTWLNAYFDLIAKDQDFYREVINNRYAVFPNQHGDFKLRSKLMHDTGIDNELKNVLSILGKDCRSYLKHPVLNTHDIAWPDKTQTDLIVDINQMLSSNRTADVAYEASCYLVTLFSQENEVPLDREEVWRLCHSVWPDKVNTRREIREWLPELWQESDKIVMERICEFISKAGNVAGLRTKLSLDDDAQTVQWLNDVIRFLTTHSMNSLLNRNEATICPNQLGQFKTRDEIFLDDGIDDELKSICSQLGKDFREELLDLQVHIELPRNRTRTPADVAQEIMQLATPKLSEVPRSIETKESFGRLFRWFAKNEGEGLTLFGEWFQSRHRLIDDEMLASAVQKDAIFTEIMEEFDIGSTDELREQLRIAHLPPRVSITPDILASLGVTSLEEFKEAMGDQNLASHFTHTSTPTIEMFHYAQALIDRAKKNVIACLQHHPAYDCTDLEELATTVLGGVKKNGADIHVVVRPSDNGEVIIFYHSEKDTLDYANAELWIDDGKSEPSHLTLGKILKQTGITRIPVKR